jgi:hypothetical protein
VFAFELGTVLLCGRVSEKGFVGDDGKRATSIMQSINSQPLGGLFRNVKEKSPSVGEHETLLEVGLSGGSDERDQRFAVESGRILVTLDVDFG